MEQGEVLIRPSSKGSDHLTCTWKVADAILHHIDIREEGKENAFSLGQSLWIDSEVCIHIQHSLYGVCLSMQYILSLHE